MLELVKVMIGTIFDKDEDFNFDIFELLSLSHMLLYSFSFKDNLLT